MSSEFQARSNNEAIIRRYPVVAYFVLTFTISWTSALAVAAPHLIRQRPLPRMTGFLMFPAMLLGPSVAGILLTRLVDGKSGLRELFSRMSPARAPASWYAALLIPPFLVPAVLLFLERFVSPVRSVWALSINLWTVFQDGALGSASCWKIRGPKMDSAIAADSHSRRAA